MKNQSKDFIYKELYKWARENDAKLNGVPVIELFPQLVDNESEIRGIAMKAPDKIYLNSKHPEPYWFKDKQVESDIEYIRKDALLEWLLKGVEMSEICHSEYGDACAQAYQVVIDKLNSM